MVFSGRAVCFGAVFLQMRWLDVKTRYISSVFFPVLMILSDSQLVTVILVLHVSGVSVFPFGMDHGHR